MTHRPLKWAEIYIPERSTKVNSRHRWCWWKQLNSFVLLIRIRWHRIMGDKMASYLTEYSASPRNWFTILSKRQNEESWNISDDNKLIIIITTTTTDEDYYINYSMIIRTKVIYRSIHMAKCSVLHRSRYDSIHIRGSQNHDDDDDDDDDDFAFKTLYQYHWHLNIFPIDVLSSPNLAARLK